MFNDLDNIVNEFFKSADDFVIGLYAEAENKEDD